MSCKRLFKIVEDTNKLSFEAQVNQMMSEGWSCMGGLVIKSELKYASGNWSMAPDTPTPITYTLPISINTYSIGMVQHCLKPNCNEKLFKEQNPDEELITGK